MAYRYGDSQRRARLDNSNAGPNAVRHITLKRAINGSASRQLRYDNNGNLTSDGVRLISYNAMNKPVTIHVSGQRYLHPNDSHRTVTQTTDFAYGSDNLRYKQRSGDVAQTIYIGQQYTEQTLANGTTQQRVYIDDVAIDITSISRGGKHNRIQSLHTDRLGSTVGVFNTSGYLHESRSYDAFGTPRGSLNSDRFNAILGSTVSPRGFTQHEHLDGAQLIHMNGRVYNYHLGRFLSVDPFIQGVGNSQGVNPYSYILNNPLAGTDPSGYVAVTGLDRWSGMPDPMGYGDNCPFCVAKDKDKESQGNGAELGGQASLNITITADDIGGQGDLGTNQGQSYSPEITGTIEPIVGSPTKGFLKSLVNDLTFGIVYGDISSIPSLKADPIDNADIEAYEEQAGAERYAMAFLPGKAAATATQTLRSLPMQIHHFATNKSKTFTPAMEKIAEKYGLKLDDMWNKQSLPHLGRHPNAYHQFVLDGMRRSHKEARGNVDTFLSGFDKYVKQPVLNNPDLLRKSGWK